MAISRRTVLLSGAAAVGLAAFGWYRPGPGGVLAAEGDFPFKLSDAEWRARLSPEAYTVLREHGTERPFTSPLNDEKGDGVFACAGCGEALFRSAEKYDSRTGWPSFWDYIPGNLGTSIDTSFMMTRTEVHCANCGGHQGHVFEDGPQPTGLRYCINGVALAFEAA